MITDASTVARRLADYVVLNSSHEVPMAALDYWELSAGAYRRLCAFARSVLVHASAVDDYHALAGNTASPQAYRRLRRRLEALLADRPVLRESAAELIAAADSEIWIDHWLGDSYTPRIPPFSLEEFGAPPQVPDAAAEARVDVIVPFRDRDRSARLRNLIACLHALRDQARPGADVRVTVVETDVVPRTRDLIAPLLDRYIHVYKEGLFNKSWAVNVGLRDVGAPYRARGHQVACVLDADILVDRSFVARNLARFAAPGHGAHLPFRWMLSLDGPSTAHVIRRRQNGHCPAADRDALRGLLLRDPPGGCLWARTDLLHRIGGFDERFEGWGGEDDDAVARLSRVTPLTRFDDLLLHLDHPRPRMLREDGQAMNAHLLDNHRGPEAWNGAAGFGDPGKYACEIGGPS